MLFDTCYSHKSSIASTDSLFAAADEFSDLIERDADVMNMIGSQAVSRKDNAGQFACHLDELVHI